MNSVIISGTIKNIVYKLVDRGNIYALIILKLEVKVFMRFKVYKHLFSVLAMLMAMLMMFLGMAFFSIRKIKR